MILEKVYDELMAQIEDLKKAVAGGSGGGTKDYDKLDNRPKVNNITLTGNKKSSDLKIAYSMTEAEYAAATKNAESIYCLQENAGTITDSAYVNLEVADWTEVSGVYKQTQPFVFEVTPAAGWTIEDVSIETGIATVDSYKVTADPFGLSITYAAETLPEYGITATVTVTINQPAGSTRIVKNGLEYCRSFGIQNLYHNEGSAESSIRLSESYELFDALQITIAYTGSAGRAITNRWILVDTIDPSLDFSVTSEAWYTKFAFTNPTTLTITGGQESKIIDVTGVKF